ncbi:hypothetical protein [Nocardia sp. NPDC051463]|uniref:hypothetical protein n=1 Tax=Nocardia sp. NPDC051463 TaxID=3154845 RepID=UPI00344F640C
MAVSKSRQMHKLATALSEQLDVKVEAIYDGPSRPRPSSRSPKKVDGGWHLRWTNGPTVAAAKPLVAELAARAADIDPDEIRYWRDNTDHSEAVMLLLWLDADPKHADYHETAGLDLPSFEISYPERADEIWERRATALQALGGGGQLRLSSIRTLLEHIQARGWPSALEWLDGLAEDGRRLRVVR